MKKSTFVLFKNLFSALFLTDIRDWRESRAIPKLRAVEKQILLRYMLQFAIFKPLKAPEGSLYPKEQFCFGEVPYAEAKEFIRIAGITSSDVVYDLGCGRGKFLFFTSLYTQAHCLGIDLVPRYISLGKKIIETLHLSHVEMQLKDLVAVDLAPASVVLIHGTTFTAETHRQIAEHILKMRPGSRVISISVSYNHPRLQLLEQKECLLSWGSTPVYFYRVIA